MSVTIDHPRLLGVVPAPIRRRIGRGLCLMGLLLAVGGASFLAGAVLPLLRGASPLMVAGGAVAAVAVLDTILLAVRGAAPLDALLRLRHARLGGEAPGAQGLVRALLLLVATLLTAGVLPLIWALRASGPFLQNWPDRLLGLVVTDVAAGRDVIAQPVRQAELDALAAPRPTAGPAIIPVTAPAQKAPSTSAQLAAPRVPAHPAEVRRAFALRVNGGPRRPIVGPTLIGRDPVPADATATIAVDDGQVSKTHLLLTPAPAPDGIWVEDLGSTNVITVTSAARPRQLAPGMPDLATAAATLHVGRSMVVIEEVGA